MRIFIAGATGVIGRPVVRLLVEQGHDVRGIARSPQRAAQLMAAGATAVRVDLFDEEALVGAVQGSDVVLNLATSIPPLRRAASASAWAENDRIRSTGATNLATAAMAARARRYIQESIVLLYADGGDAWLDENSPIVAHPRVQSLLVAENQVARAVEHGLAGVTLRFGLFHGPEGSHAQQVLALARRGICPSIGGADDFVPVIAVDDAATAVVAALEAPSGTYNIVDDEPLRRRDYCAVLCRGAGRDSGMLAPAAVGRMKSVRHLAQSLRVSNARFKDATGWQPRFPSIRESWPAALEHMRGGAPAQPQGVG